MSVLFWDPTAVRSPAAARALLAVGALIAGYILAREFAAIPSSAWFSAGAGLCAIAAAVGGRRQRRVVVGLLLLAMMSVGGGWFALRIHEHPADRLDVLLGGSGNAARGDVAGEVGAADGGVVITVEGIIATAPEVLPPLRDMMNPRAPRSPRMQFDVLLDTVHGETGPRGVSGRVRVRIGEVEAGPGVVDAGANGAIAGASGAGALSESLVPLRAGQRVRLTGVFSPPRAPMNPGSPDRRLWAAQDGRVGTMSLPRRELVRQIETRPGVLAWARSVWLGSRGWATMRARSLLLGDDGAATGEASPARALLGALILGEQEPALREVRGAFTRLGLAHVLCISGFHLAMLAGVAMFTLRLWRDIGWWESALVALLLAVYLMVLPFQAPVWRAALMVLGLLVGDALGRRYDRLAVLAWIALIMLIWRPMDAWSIGFQLSFGLVGVLIWLGHALHQRIWGVKLRGVVHPDPGARGLALEWFKGLFTANLLCWAVASPLILYHTGLVSPLAVLAGVVAVPLIMLVLIGGYAVVLLGIVVPPAAALARAGAEWLAGVSSWCAAKMDVLPLTSLSLPPVSLAWTVGATGVVLYWCWRGHVRHVPAWCASAVMTTWLFVEIGPGSALPARTALRVDALAVGDGTCMVVRAGGTREAVLWDCGSLTPGIGEVTIPRAVRGLGIARIETAIITHANLDHFNALLDVAGPVGLRRVVLGERFVERAEARRHGPEAYVLEELEGRGIEVVMVTAGARMDLGGASFEFVSPPRGVVWKSENDHSLAAVVRPVMSEGAPARTLLLVADVEREAMGYLGPVLDAALPGGRADIMEAPHHGSAKDPAFEFVARLDPAVVLQSTGMSRVGDARWDTIRAGRRWHTTATDGAAWAEIWRDGTVATGTMRDRR